ncbi:MAG: DUF4428 domain-containing protein [Oscillospiraceae bacterium]|nr:DUF4428 domain-containing protein [Oscillospiraceae bacterium]
MGLFSKEDCVFCGTEVGMLKRSKLQTKEYICNDCKRKTNPFARMDYTSKDNAQRMMDTLAQEAADFEASFDSAENRFQSAERSFKTWDLGNHRVQYRCNTRLGAFQIISENHSRYEHVPVFYFDTMIPYRFADDNPNLADFRNSEIMDSNAEYVTVKEEKDMDGKLTGCTVIIPYNDICIREIKLNGNVSDENDKDVFYDLADRINSDRKAWINNGIYDTERKNRMQMRNLKDTAAAVVKAAASGGSVEDAVKQGIDTANAIEEGKVKQGFFGKLFRK